MATQEKSMGKLERARLIGRLLSLRETQATLDGPERAKVVQDLLDVREKLGFENAEPSATGEDETNAPTAGGKRQVKLSDIVDRGKYWSKRNESRTYINDKETLKLAGYKLEYYKSGGIKHAEDPNGEKISNNKASGLLWALNRVYYDWNNRRFSKDIGKILNIEIIDDLPVDDRTPDQKLSDRLSEAGPAEDVGRIYREDIGDFYIPWSGLSPDEGRVGYKTVVENPALSDMSRKEIDDMVAQTIMNGVAHRTMEGVEIRYGDKTAKFAREWPSGALEFRKFLVTEEGRGESFGTADKITEEQARHLRARVKYKRDVKVSDLLEVGHFKKEGDEERTYLDPESSLMLAGFRIRNNGRTISEAHDPNKIKLNPQHVIYTMEALERTYFDHKKHEFSRDIEPLIQARVIDDLPPGYVPPPEGWERYVDEDDDDDDDSKAPTSLKLSEVLAVGNFWSKGGRMRTYMKEPEFLTLAGYTVRRIGRRDYDVTAGPDGNWLTRQEANELKDEVHKFYYDHLTNQFSKDPVKVIGIPIIDDMSAKVDDGTSESNDFWEADRALFEKISKDPTPDTLTDEHQAQVQAAYDRNKDNPERLEFMTEALNAWSVYAAREGAKAATSAAEALKKI